MQSLQLQNDTLIDIATFLARRWSGKENVTVGFSKIRQNETRLKEKKVLLMPNEHYYGNDFQRYRQFRVSIWYEAMRLKHCEKILSNDHAFGFILNAIDTRRIELVGIKVWKGMVEELIFNYTNMWLSRANLGSIFGKARTVEAFYQYFLFGDINDPDSYIASAKRAAAIGIEGKWAIHPSQIDLANKVFSPPEDEENKAKRILEELDKAAKEGKGAAQLDGRMIDAASARMAENIVNINKLIQGK